MMCSRHHCLLLLIIMMTMVVIHVVLVASDNTAMELHIPNFSDHSNITILKEAASFSGATYSNATNAMLLTPLPRPHHYLNATFLTGRFIYNEPLHLLLPSSSGRRPNAGPSVMAFNTSFVFRLITSVDNRRNPCSSNFVFTISDFVQSPPLTLSADDSSSSSADKITLHSFLAVQFDSYFHDPRGCHIAVNVGRLTTLNLSNTAGQHEAHQLYRNFCLDTNDTFKAWVEYDNTTHFLNVWLASAASLPAATGLSRPAAPPLLQYNYDLASVIHDSMFAGFTGTSYVDRHCNGVGIAIYAWDLATGIVPTPSNVPSPPPAHTHNGEAAKRWGLAASAAASAVIVVVVLKFRGFRRRQKAAVVLSTTNVDGGGGMRMRYSTVSKATGGFAEKNKVGEGAFGLVYKGELRDGSIVAVKRLKKSMRRDEEFAMEMKVIGSIRHRNLLELKGWCYDKGEAILVYEFMSNGSLDSYLFGSDDDTGISKSVRAGVKTSCLTEEEGKRRLTILTDVAAALSYLHSSLGQCVLHRDVKSANVLLTADMEARLADFGMARLVQHHHSFTPTMALGTAGYIAPEVMMTAKITDKSDVYSFGVLMLETACGRRAILTPDSRKGAEPENLVAYVAHHLRKGTIAAALEPSIRQGGSEWKWVEVLHMGLACCQYSATARPRMSDVHRMLQCLGLAAAPAEVAPPMWSSVELHELASDILVPNEEEEEAAAQWSSHDSRLFDSSTLLLAAAARN